jgi:hypothetical protein
MLSAKTILKKIAERDGLPKKAIIEQMFGKALGAPIRSVWSKLKQVAPSSAATVKKGVMGGVKAVGEGMHHLNQAGLASGPGLAGLLTGDAGTLVQGAVHGISKGVKHLKTALPKAPITHAAMDGSIPVMLRAHP